MKPPPTSHASKCKVMKNEFFCDCNYHTANQEHASDQASVANQERWAVEAEKRAKEEAKEIRRLTGRGIVIGSVILIGWLTVPIPTAVILAIWLAPTSFLWFFEAYWLHGDSSYQGPGGWLRFVLGG